MSDPSDVPISVPVKLKHDRAIRRLLTAWANAHARFRVCEKRLNPRVPNARKLERARRREKWVCAARILHVEHRLFRWLATATHHPDLWTPPKRGNLSRRNELLRKYYQRRSAERYFVGAARRTAIEQRGLIVAAIRALDRAWMFALWTHVYPDLRPPSPLKLHPRELLPRKIARASRVLTTELLEMLPPPPRVISIIATLRRRTAA